jgi:hypothetical protein
MIEKGYQAIFMTTYKDAFKTNQYHEKNGMKHIYDYTSLQTYDDGKKADISCFLNQDIKAYRDDLKRYIDQKLSQGIGYKLGEIIY